MTDAPATNELLALAERCREIREWHRTGLLCDGEIRKLAERMPVAMEHAKLHLAETKTAEEAMDFVIRAAATPSAQGAEVGVEDIIPDIREAIQRAWDDIAGNVARALLGKYRMEKR